MPSDKFESLRCPFNLAQAPAYFQRLINNVLVGLPFAFGYLDDVLIFSPDPETHLKHVEMFFRSLRKANLKLKASKCSYLKQHIQYLGHLISGDRIQPVQEKLESVQKMPPPTTPKEVKQFLRQVGYYQKFIPWFTHITQPMSNPTKLDVNFVWMECCQESFEFLKEALIHLPILKYSNLNKPYTLFTDASKQTWDCVLTQEYEYEKENKTYKVNHPITFQSSLFKGSQFDWATLTKEAFAIYASVKKTFSVSRRC